MWHLPPAHLTSQLDPEGHVVSQLPPPHVTLHVDSGWQIILQSPPGQSSEHVAPLSHFISHLPPSQVEAHLSPAAQSILHFPSLHEAAALALAVALPPEDDDAEVAFIVDLSPKPFVGVCEAPVPLLDIASFDEAVFVLSLSEPPDDDVSLPEPLPVPLPSPSPSETADPLACALATQPPINSAANATTTR